ncbi:MAG: long-chain fatty acid--CoA ligase, partial [Spirochaetaceae bacterium]
MFLKDQKKIALLDGDQTVTYQELLQNISSLATTYRLNKGDRAVIFFENSPLWVYAFYSVWSNRGINVPVDCSLKADELAYIIDDCTPTILLCTAKERAVAETACANVSSPPRIILLDETAGIKRVALSDTGEKTAPESMDDTAVIMYTSGTTGKPKGVMLSYDNLLASIEGVRNLGMITSSDSIIALLPFYHIFPLQGSVLAPLSIGSQVVFIRNLNKDEIFATLQKHRVTMFLGVPRLYKLFHDGIMAKVKASPFAYALFIVARLIFNLKLSRLLFGRIHRAFGGQIHSYLIGGAKLEPEIARNLWALGFLLVEGYGKTETAPLITFNPG